MCCTMYRSEFTAVCSGAAVTMEVGEHAGGGVCVSGVQHWSGSVPCEGRGHVPAGLGGKHQPTALQERTVPSNQ